MLLIPIAQENSEVRRTPWVSYALILANVAVTFAIFLAFSPESSRKEFEERFRAVVQYLDQHPYLLVPPELAERLAPEVLEEIERFRAESESLERPSESVLARQQEELDSLARRAMEVVQQTAWMRWGFIPTERRPITLLTSMFVHAGWLHLVFNMLFLFLTGPFLEDVFGRVIFATLYLVSGVAAIGVFALHFPDSTTPLIGASGAIAGVMGAFLLRLGFSRIQFLVLPIPILPVIRFTMFLPAFVVMPAWLLEQVWYARHTDAESGVAWWAHIGGFLFGLVAAAAVKLMGLEESWVNPAIEKEISLVQHPSLDLAVEARTNGRLAAARAQIAKVLADDPRNLDAFHEAYEIAQASGDLEEIGRTATRLLEAYGNRGEKQLANDLVEELTRPSSPVLPGRFCLAAAAFLEKEGDGRGALQMYQRVVEHWPKDPGAFRAWYRQGEIFRRAGDARRAREAYRQARAHPGCVDHWVQAVERGLAELPAPVPTHDAPTGDAEPVLETSAGAPFQPGSPPSPKPTEPRR